MKSAILTLLITLIPSAFAGAAELQHWVNESEKIIVIARNPKLKVRVTKLEAAEDYYASLEIDLTYQESSANALEELMARYPGYKTQGAVLEKAEVYRLQIPSLGVDRAVDPKPGAEGPWLNELVFLTRKQYQAVRSELIAGRTLATITGHLVAVVPMMKVIERKELDASVCESLLGKEKDVHSMLARVSALMQSEARSMQHESTRATLERDVRKNCFELTGPARVESFSDILQLGLRAKRLSRKLVGETLQKTYSRQEIGLAYELDQTGGDGI